MWYHRDPAHLPSALERTERRLAYALLGCVGFGLLNVVAWSVIWSVARHVPAPPPPLVIDPGGMVLYSGPPGSYAEETLWTMTELQRLIALVRERRGDAVHMAERHHDASKFFDGPAVTQFKAYLAAIKADPQHSSNPPRVQVGHFAWEPPAGHDYAVKWVERWTPTFGTEAQTLRVSGRFTVERRQRMGPFGQRMHTVGDMNGNPHGIYVTSFSWMEEWDAPPTARSSALAR